MGNKAILQTLLYSDIFNYPLTKEELWLYLISTTPVSKKEFVAALKNSAPFIEERNKYFFLKGRSRIVDLRMQRENESKKKYALAKMVARVLSKIPSIQLIAISGGLAMNNSDKNDDIDLFIICSNKTVWVTRFLVLLLLEIMGLRRKRNAPQTKDKICINIIMDDSMLSLDVRRRNVYTAHEVAQVKPIINKNNMYHHFLLSNSWIKTFLVNTSPKKISIDADKIHKGIFVCPLKIVDPFFYYIQMLYMRGHITIEEVTRSFVFLHPVDYSNITLKTYYKRIKKYEEI